MQLLIFAYLQYLVGMGELKPKHLIERSCITLKNALFYLSNNRLF